MAVRLDSFTIWKRSLKIRLLQSTCSGSAFSGKFKIRGEPFRTSEHVPGQAVSKELL